MAPKHVSYLGCTEKLISKGNGAKLKTPRPISGVLVALALTMVLSACASAEAKEIAKFDPAEVEWVENDARQNGVEPTDEYVLSTLHFRANCVSIKTVLEGIAAGGEPQSYVSDLEELIAQAESSPDSAGQASAYTVYQDELRQGKFDNLAEFYGNSCSNAENQ